MATQHYIILPKNDLMGSPLDPTHHYLTPVPQATGEERRLMSEGKLDPLAFHRPPPNAKLRLLFGDWLWVHTRTTGLKRIE
jgi:hypothetical protein